MHYLESLDRDRTNSNVMTARLQETIDYTNPISNNMENNQ